MAILDAFRDLGSIEEKTGLEAHLKLPMNQKGQAIRVFLKVKDTQAEPLEVVDVEHVDLVQYLPDVKMLKDYIYHDRAGSNVSWGYSPIHHLRKPKNSQENYREILWGKSGQWDKDKDSHLFKLRYRLLEDFEKEGCLAPGAVDRIMQGLETKIIFLLDDLDPKQSTIIVFGVEQNGRFLYPGQIPAFVKYFKKKLALSFSKYQPKKSKQTSKRCCALCEKEMEELIPLDKVFKFATFDKANILPSLDEREKAYIFAVCEMCMEKLNAARERVDRTLTNTATIPGLKLWIVPETAGPGKGSSRLKNVIETLEGELAEGELKGPAEKWEQGYFTRIAKEGQGLVFHFVFWEKNNAQEIIHLMAEDIPPERLALIERLWKEVVVRHFGYVPKVKLPQIFASLYLTMREFSGKGDSDVNHLRDFVLKVIGCMLQGRTVPVETFKQHLVTRIPGIIHSDAKWDKVRDAFSYAHLWAEYMYRLNEEVMR